MANEKCVHTEHCDSVMGCKYGDLDCPVWLGYKKQSYVDEDLDQIYEIPLEEYEARRAKLDFHYSLHNLY